MQTGHPSFLQQFAVNPHGTLAFPKADRVSHGEFRWNTQTRVNVRTTNPIESTFATIRLRHRRTKGSGTRRTSLAMMFKLAESASKKWRRLRGYQQITLVVQGRQFIDGTLQEHAA